MHSQRLGMPMPIQALPLRSTTVTVTEVVTEAVTEPNLTYHCHYRYQT